MTSERPTSSAEAPEPPAGPVAPAPARPLLSPAVLRAIQTVPRGGARNRLRLALAVTGVRQTAVVKATGIAAPHLSDLVNGRYVHVTVETARTLATYFGCEIADLFPADPSIGRPPGHFVVQTRDAGGPWVTQASAASLPEALTVGTPFATDTIVDAVGGVRPRYAGVRVVRVRTVEHEWMPGSPA